MNIENVVERIIDASGIRPLENTCDQLITGNWDCDVTGIVTTFMATVDVIKNTIKKGSNLIITHEPTFFTGRDTKDWLKQDEVYQEKIKLIEENNINIWRFHDYMHMTNPDLIYLGLIKEMEWEKFTDPQDKHCFGIPATNVMDLTELFKKKLNVKNVRLIGNTDGTVSRLAILVGGGSLGLGSEEMPMELMREANLDLIVCGELLEWTLCAYVRDASQLGMNKSLIVLGHNRTEEVGMKYLPEWLQPVLPGLQISFIEAGEPFKHY